MAGYQDKKKTNNHPNTDQARLRATLLIRPTSLPLCQTTTNKYDIFQNYNTVINKLHTILGHFGIWG